MRHLFIAPLLFLPFWATAQSAADSTAPAAPVVRPLAAASPAAGLPDSTVVKAAADTTLQRLQGLSAEERRELGRTDAKRGYRPKGAFWAGMGVGLLTTPLLATGVGLPVTAAGSLGGALAVGSAGPKEDKLQASAPQPALLRDADYHKGYKQQASKRKSGRVMLGWGTGLVVSFVGLVVAVAIALSGGFS